MSTHTSTHPGASNKEVKTYIVILAVLITLTVITVLAAGVKFESGAINVVIALTIATIKASLVGLFFMHLLHDKPLNGVILVSGFVFLGLLLGFTLTDATSRVVIEPANLKPPGVMPAKPASAIPPPSHK